MRRGALKRSLTVPRSRSESQTCRFFTDRVWSHFPSSLFLLHASLSALCAYRHRTQSALSNLFHAPVSSLVATDQQSLKHPAETPDETRERWTAADKIFLDPVRQPSPGLNTNLPSNNPFRNRTASPANSLPSPVNAGFNLQPTTAPERPTSRNPFLDNSEKTDASAIRVRSASPPKPPTTMDRSTKPNYSSHAQELFVCCYLVCPLKSAKC